jgi:HPt (histidine-containing phosphotransfer) domain-containing protein
MSFKPAFHSCAQNGSWSVIVDGFGSVSSDGSSFEPITTGGPHTNRRTIGSETVAARSLQQPKAAVLDIAHLRTFTGGNLEFEREVYGLFLGELPKTLTALTSSTTAREWHMAAHTLKGSALGVGAFALAAAARAAEQLGSPDHPASPAALMAIRSAIAEVSAEARRLQLA